MQKTPATSMQRHGCNLNHHGVPTTPATALSTSGRQDPRETGIIGASVIFDWEVLERALVRSLPFGEVYAASSGRDAYQGAATTTTRRFDRGDLDWGLDPGQALAPKDIGDQEIGIDVSAEPRKDGALTSRSEQPGPLRSRVTGASQPPRSTVAS